MEIFFFLHATVSKGNVSWPLTDDMREIHFRVLLCDVLGLCSSICWIWCHLFTGAGDSWLCAPLCVSDVLLAFLWLSLSVTHSWPWEFARKETLLPGWHPAACPQKLSCRGGGPVASLPREGSVSPSGIVGVPGSSHFLTHVSVFSAPMWWTVGDAG